VILKYLVERDVIRHVGFVKRRSPAADELDAIEGLFRGVVKVVHYDNVIASDEKLKRGE
jgi:hypothetical protein